MNNKKKYLPIQINFEQFSKADVLETSGDGFSIFDNWQEDIF